MNAIITVVGSDKVGIIATVSSFLSEHKINIEDITQNNPLELTAISFQGNPRLN